MGRRNDTARSRSIRAPIPPSLWPRLTLRRRTGISTETADLSISHVALVYCQTFVMRDNRMHTVEKALRVLSAFPADGREVSLTELSVSSGIERSIVYRILYTCRQQGFVSKSPRTRRYRLGKRLVELGQVATALQDLRQIALPVMRQLSDTTGESILLCVCSDGEGVCVEGVEPPDTSIRFVTRVGERFPIHAGAAGKVLLAFQPDDVLEEHLRTPLRRYTENTITDPARLRHELATIRARGYATSHGEVEIKRLNR